MFRDQGATEATRLAAREGLVTLHLPLVEHCARRFRNRGEPFEDLVQVGTIGLIKSIDGFDLDRGVEFSTYATPTIIGEIKRYFRDKGWAIRVPRRLQELRMQIAATTSELTQSLGRSPTPRELAETIGCTVEEIIEGIESSNAYSTLSLDATDDNGEDGSVSMLEMMGLDDEELEHVEIRESLKPLLEALPPREKRILLLRFFRNKTQSEIAAEIGVSQMHVSRLLGRTLDQLPGVAGGQRLTGSAVGPWSSRASMLAGCSRPASTSPAIRAMPDRHPGGGAAEEAPGETQEHQLGEDHRAAGPGPATHHQPRAPHQRQSEEGEEQRRGDTHGGAVGMHMGGLEHAVRQQEEALDRHQARRDHQRRWRCGVLEVVTHPPRVRGSSGSVTKLTRLRGCFATVSLPLWGARS